MELKIGKPLIHTDKRHRYQDDGIDLRFNIPFLYFHLFLNLKKHGQT